MSEELRYTFDMILEHISVCEFRFKNINTPKDFETSDHGKTMLDAIAMRLQAMSELVKRHVRHNPEFTNKYPDIDWIKIIKFRDFISHHYELLDFEVIYGICKYDLTKLKEVVNKELNAL